MYVGVRKGQNCFVCEPLQHSVENNTLKCTAKNSQVKNKDELFE